MDLLNPEYVSYWLIAVNFATFAAFGIDKAKAERGARRISEAALLQWAFFGGTPAAYAARQLFRHKTRKQPFSNNLHMMAIIQISALAGLLVYFA
ncbi:DUF1294 domain-containing protein [Allopontixanthobacter sp.]|uniref:DUF1294 domain-containing protein n=1 Tax=Allopontixanthobacter sp. TaxID=2906452 RepID=UPI002ABB175B|nr:DUF1294 domain-containing protein [Allopontixanthobacter sp.]MDZ4307250.1 DUF1294 domain-containing protein [Allopontixanthobacter sp.]